MLPNQETKTPKFSEADDWLTPLSNDDVTELPGIVVIGRPHNPGGFYNPDDYGWDGHDTSYSPPPPPTTGDERPDCVSASPDDIDEDMLMKIIQYLTDELRGVYNEVPGNDDIDSSRFEYGVAIYELDGQIGYGDITTNNSPDFVRIITRGVPDGARIIAIMHNHPDTGEDDRVPSDHFGGDWDQYRDVVNSALSRGIEVDPNLLLVLYTN